MIQYFKKYLKYFLVISALAALTMFVFFLGNIFDQPEVNIVPPEAPGGWKEVIEVASGMAFKGPWRMNDSMFLYVDDPTAAVAKNGDILILWADQEKKDIFLQRYSWEGKKIFEKPINVSRTPRIFSWLPRMKISQDGSEVYIAWQEIIFSGGSHGGEILFTRSLDGGKTFSEPINLSNSLAGDGKGRLSRDIWDNGSLDIALDKEGNIYVAWTSYEGGLMLTRSFNQGKEFLAPEHIAGSNREPARAPSLAVSSNGTIYLAWAYGEVDSENIHFAVADGVKEPFIPRGPAVATRGFADAPNIAVDKTGTVHLVFSRAPQRFSTQSEIYYSRLDLGKEKFSEPIKISVTTNDWERSGYPKIAISDNNIYVLWELFIAREFSSRGLGFTHWSIQKDEPLPTDKLNFFIIRDGRNDDLGINGSLQGMLTNKLAISPAGKIVIVNSTFKENESSHIWLYRNK